MSDLKELQAKIIDFRDARDWQQFHNPKDIAISLMLEAGELLEHFQWRNEAEVEEYIKKHKEEIGEEMADVMNYLLILAHDLGIDLIEASKAKVSKNEKKYPIVKAKGSHKKYTDLEA